MPRPSSETKADGGGVAFTTTHWSVVLTAQGESPAADEALEKLCRKCWIVVAQRDANIGEFGYIFNSVPDQYLARAGIGYLVWPKYGLSVSVGGRMEGVPVEDFIGDSHGWRNPGYAFYFEPGISITKGRFSASVTGPIAVHRHANKNLTDVKVSKELGLDFGGNAAFADYLITTSFSIRF